MIAFAPKSAWHDSSLPAQSSCRSGSNAVNRRKSRCRKTPQWAAACLACGDARRAAYVLSQGIEGVPRCVLSARRCCNSLDSCRAWRRVNRNSNSSFSSTSNTTGNFCKVPGALLSTCWGLVCRRYHPGCMRALQVSEDTEHYIPLSCGGKCAPRPPRPLRYNMRSRSASHKTPNTMAVSLHARDLHACLRLLRLM